MKSYIDIPQFTTLEDIRKRDYTLSASQYKTFCIKNQSTKTVADFLERGLERSDLGVEVGSEAYVEKSKYVFIKTKALQEETYLLNDVKDALGLTISTMKSIICKGVINCALSALLN